MVSIWPPPGMALRQSSRVRPAICTSVAGGAGCGGGGVVERRRVPVCGGGDDVGERGALAEQGGREAGQWGQVVVPLQQPAGRVEHRDAVLQVFHRRLPELRLRPERVLGADEAVAA